MPDVRGKWGSLLPSNLKFRFPKQIKYFCHCGSDNIIKIWDSIGLKWITDMIRKGRGAPVFARYDAISRLETVFLTNKNTIFSNIDFLLQRRKRVVSIESGRITQDNTTLLRFFTKHPMLIYG